MSWTYLFLFIYSGGADKEFSSFHLQYRPSRMIHENARNTRKNPALRASIIRLRSLNRIGKKCSPRLTNSRRALKLLSIRHAAFDSIELRAKASIRETL